MYFIQPIHGDMLHARDGALTGESLKTKVSVAAPAGNSITINGVQTNFEDSYYSAEIELSDYENTLEAVNATTGEHTRITVYRLKNFAGKYRLSIDDNIWFLRDIQQQADVYSSLFEHPYLAVLKEINDTYGTKIHLNLFYETEGFNLSQFTDKFKEEWKDNAGWLTLSFHARGEFPDQPYISADYDTVKKDCDLVIGEIRRFAGEEVMTGVTTIHWGEATREASRALRDAGYRGQLGYFNVDDDLYPASYYLSVEERRHIKKRFVWKDMSENVVFIKTSIVIDIKKIEEIEPWLNQYAEEGSSPPYVDLLVHEQYFYSSYFNYQPDYREKLITAVKWAHNNGYQPAFLDTCISE
ncbi:hypothetical protein DYBT9275_00398 [Dyadobacter sp. CECT 9275]|uniref:Uncharacterized protein n=2 Tax=Dyadobacter helix TaxID=2822344 RepID=A0A916J9C3_9BACT|nr:hypothetical protein DYBT9275_00398 [Dyadobacter sp. CECT 9275]